MSGFGMRRWPGAVVLAALALFALAVAGCGYGDGSDIGPSLDPLPAATFEVLVRGPGDRAVVNAGVSIASAAGVVARTGGDGRADLAVQAPTRPTLSIDASLAAVAVGVEPASLVCSGPTVADGSEPAFVVHLADLAPSAGLRLVAGPGAGGVLDDRASSGARLEVAPGAVVEAGGADPVLIRSGRLDPDRIPPLTRPDGLPALSTAGIVVDPPQLRLTPGGSLSVPNDVGLAAGANCPLFATDPVTGDWRQVAIGSVSADGTRIEAGIGAVGAGGCYAFVAEPAATTTVTGRVVAVAVADPPPLPSVLVRVGQALAVTDPAGRFTVTDVAATDASGALRRLRVTVHGNRLRFAAGRSVEVDAVPQGVTEAGDIAVPAAFAGGVRTLTLFRGRAVDWLDLGFGDVRQTSIATGVTGADGRLDVGDLSAGVFAAFGTVPDPGRADQVLVVDRLATLPEGRRSIDLRLFQEPQRWLDGGRGTQLRAVDAASGTLLEGVRAFRSRAGAAREFLGESTFASAVRAELLADDEITVASDTTAGGRRVRAAFSTFRVAVNSIEMPLERARPDPLGVFEPFAWVRGTVPGQNGAPIARAEPTRTGTNWLDTALADRGFDRPYPVRLAPDIARPAFDVGVPPRSGNLVTARGRSLGGDLLGGLEELAVAVDLQLDGGRPLEIVLPAPLAADATFRLGRGFVGLDARVTATDLRLDTALWFPDGRAVHIARGLADNLSRDGDDALLRLPPRTGPLAGARWLAVVIAPFLTADVSGVQRGIHVVGDDAPRERPLLPVPEVVEPAARAAVPVAGFTVRFRVPADALYARVRLASLDRSDDRRTWTALLPADVEEFRFAPLPDGPDLLTPGDYQLVVEAVRVDDGLLFRQPLDAWQALISRFVGISALERSTAAVSTTSVLLTLVD